MQDARRHAGCLSDATLFLKVAYTCLFLPEALETFPEEGEGRGLCVLSIMVQGANIFQVRGARKGETLCYMRCLCGMPFGRNTFFEWHINVFLNRRWRHFSGRLRTSWVKGDRYVLGIVMQETI